MVAIFDKYPKGICPYCKEEFSRMGKFMSETESFHIKGHRLDEIEKYIEETSIQEFDYFKIIYDIEYISKVSSLGARNDPPNKYWNRMLRCKKLEEAANKRLEKSEGN